MLSMRRIGIIIGLLLALVGVVWILQGLRVAFAPQSFMTGNRQWAVGGGLAVAIGLFLAGWSSRRSPGADIGQPIATPAARGPEQVTAALVSGTAAYNVAQNVILPSWSYVPLNTAATVGLFKLAGRLGLTRDEVGSDRAHLARGIRIGASLGAVTVIGIAAAVAIPGTRSLFRDGRVIGVGVGGALFQALIRLPVGTALFEETLFRGVLFAWLRRRTSTLRAAVGSSVLFGLWHALPAWSTISLYQEGAIRDAGAAASVGVVVGGVVASGMAGAGLVWLRLRTNSLAAPVIVHAAANSASYLAAFAIARWL